LGKLRLDRGSRGSHLVGSRVRARVRARARARVRVRVRGSHLVGSRGGVKGKGQD